MKGVCFKEGNKFAGQNYRASSLENGSTFFRVWNTPFWLRAFCLLFWRLVMMSIHRIVVIGSEAAGQRQMN